MSAMASQITNLTTVYSGADQRKHQSPASLAFVRGIHRWPVHSSHKGPVTRKIFPFDDVIMMIHNDDGNIRFISVMLGDTTYCYMTHGPYIMQLPRLHYYVFNPSRVEFETIKVYRHFLTILNTLRARQNGRPFADDIFKCIFFSQNVLISLKILLKFVPNVRVNHILSLI